MQKNIFSCALGVVVLSLFCSCGTCKKEEVKVDAKDQAQVEQIEKKIEAEVNTSKEVASAAPQAEVPVDSSAATPATEENKVA
jgi:hypothetical protein